MVSSTLLATLVFELELAAQQPARVVGHSPQPVFERLPALARRLVFGRHGRFGRVRWLRALALAAGVCVATGAAAQPTTRLKFQLDWRFEGPAALFLVPKAKGYFQQEGLEVIVETEGGARGVSTPESGVSTGKHEAAFLLDGGERYKGLGLRRAVEVINTVIAPALKGLDVTAQGEIDRLMIELDGTPNKSKLGANSIVGVSLAALKAAAASAGAST